MRWLLLLVLTGCLGCDLEIQIEHPFINHSPAAPQERPVVNPPHALRQENWLGDRRQGSCVWASTITLLHWQGQHDLAEWVRRTRGNGEWPENWSRQMDAAGIRYAMTTDGNVEFLEWAVRTRRGAAVTVLGGAHMVNLIHLDDRWACLLDNNNPATHLWVPRDRFLAEWHASRGWGLTVVYSPYPPLTQ